MTRLALPSPTASAFRAARRLRVELARHDVNAFAELVVRDEQTGAPLRQAEHHRQWQALADRHAQLVIWAAIEHGKSLQLAIARTLFELGRDPTLRIAIVSNVHGQAVRFVRTIGRYVERSGELREVFPNLRPATPWTEAAITVTRPTLSKDPSVVAYGLHGAVLGSRIDRLVLDDPLDYESTRTPEQRRTTREWVTSTLLSRTTGRGRVIAVGTPWSPEDLLHELAGRAWPAYRFAIEREDGTPRWPEAWSSDRIAAKRRELGPVDAARSLDCIARSSDDAIIEEGWVVAALARGERATILEHRPEGLYLPDRAFEFAQRVVLGVDPAFSTKRTADLSALTAVMVHRDGSREILGVESGRWHGPDLLGRIQSARRRFGARTVAIEANQSQVLLGQWLRALEGEGVDVLPVVTGRGTNSMQARIEQLASEMATGRWIIPSCGGRGRDREIEQLVRDLLNYSPRNHTPDRLAALVIAAVGAEGEEEVGEVGHIDFRR